jgi:hypothetical protein
MAVHKLMCDFSFMMPFDNLVRFHHSLGYHGIGQFFLAITTMTSSLPATTNTNNETQQARNAELFVKKA